MKLCLGARSWGKGVEISTKKIWMTEFLLFKKERGLNRGRKGDEGKRSMSSRIFGVGSWSNTTKLLKIPESLGRHLLRSVSAGRRLREIMMLFQHKTLSFLQ